MSAAQFIHVLENELGWNPPKDRKKLQATDLEWMFISDDANKAFLSWICNNITKRNLLTDEELQQYEASAFSRHGCLWLRWLNFESKRIFQPRKFILLHLECLKTV